MRQRVTGLPREEPEMTERLFLFDTTLRDGEQAPGFSMCREEKLTLAKALDRLGVDVLEAGFPAASDGDFEAARAIAREVETAGVAALCRCHADDIDRAWSAIRDARKPRLHTFLATSPIHREHKLRMQRDEVVERVRVGVARAREVCADVEFSAEDASRTEFDFLVEVFSAAAEAGATTLNVPDTVGYALPADYEQLIAELRAALDRYQVVLSVHCHDDLGLAVANSLAGVRGGARQVEATICGIGERAGNAALEEVAMALCARGECFGVRHAIDTPRLHATARLLEGITGQSIPRNKAIVGRNAFSHESGIHQHGMLAHRETYEVLRPEDVGQAGTSLVLGKHSGRHALRQRLIDLGLACEGERLDELFQAFKDLADRKSEVRDEDLEALVLGAARHAPGPWTLLNLQTTAGTHALATASVEVEHEDGRRVIEAATGDGPIDASFRALARATDASAELRDFQVKSVTLGNDALGRVSIECAFDGRPMRGQGVSTDIVEASAFAFLDVVNRTERRAAQTEGALR